MRFSPICRLKSSQGETSNVLFSPIVYIVTKVTECGCNSLTCKQPWYIVTMETVEEVSHHLLVQHRNRLVWSYLSLVSASSNMVYQEPT